MFYNLTLLEYKKLQRQPIIFEESSDKPQFVEGIILSVGDDDVIHEEDAHHVTGLTDISSEFLVSLAGAEVARGMVVADGKDGGIGKHRLTDDNTDIDGRLCDATM